MIPSHSAIFASKHSRFEGKGLRAWHSGVVTTTRVYSSVPLAFWAWVGESYHFRLKPDASSTRNSDCSFRSVKFQP
ncbi:hypothetical protein AHAS_Ahas10G0067400 [Arachis hypogaea]